jgi:hypothetical protein
MASFAVYAALLILGLLLRSKTEPRRVPARSTLLDYNLMHLHVKGLDSCVSKIHTELTYLLRHPTCKLGYWRRRDYKLVHSSNFGWTEHQVANHMVSYLPRVGMQRRLEQVDHSEWKVGLYIMACQDGYIDGSNLRIYYHPTIVDSVGLVRLLHRIFDHPRCRFLYRRFQPKLQYAPVLAEVLSVTRWMMRYVKSNMGNRVAPHRTASSLHGVISASTKFVEILQADANISMYSAIVHHVVWSYYQSLECTELDHRVLDKRGISVRIHYTHDWEDLLDTMQVGRYGARRLHFHPVQLDMPLRSFVRTAPREMLPIQIRNRTRVTYPFDANLDVVDLNVSVLPILCSPNDDFGRMNKALRVRF